MKKIITISRQFGAGGGELGRRTAKALGLPFYDKDLILRTAMASSGLSPEQVRRWDERVPTTFGFTQSLFDFITARSAISCGKRRSRRSVKWPTRKAA